MERNATTTEEDDDDDLNTTNLDTLMIPNSQPSPTTGVYYSLPTQNLSCYDDVDLDNFLSTNQNPKPGDGDFYCLQNQDIGAAYMKQQQLIDFELPSDVSLMNISSDGMNADFSSCTNMNKFYNALMPNLPDDNSRLHTDRTSCRNEGNQHVIEDDKIASSPLIGIANGYEDGYNWRKYGQKQVKGSECPRSYYKCTNPNCEAKKKVEWARTGKMTQIIYSGKHNHPMPFPNRRFVNDEKDTMEDNNSHGKIKDGSVWINPNFFSEDDRVSSMNWSEGSGVEFTKSVLSQLSIENTPDNNEYFNPLPHCQDADDAKRRRTDDSMVEPNMSSTGIREDKIIVQAESEIDIIDDGYRWRKYGQKVVKGNPNPRSYYKCTSPGCLVRKHVERNSQNIKDVMTTYEGRHNHEVPPEKNSSSSNKDVGNSPSDPFTGQASHISLTRSSTFPTVEIPDNKKFHIPHFQRTSVPGNELLFRGLIGNLGTGMSFGSSPAYNSDFPMPYGSLEQDIPNFDIPQVGMTSDLVNQPLSTLPGSINSNMNPDFPMPYGSFEQYIPNLDIPQVGMNLDLVNQPLSTLPGFINSNMTPDFNIGVVGTDHQLAHHPGYDFDAIRRTQEKNG